MYKRQLSDGLKTVGKQCLLDAKYLRGKSSETIAEQGKLCLLYTSQNMEDVDDFDFICHIAYGKKTLTRHERAEQVQKRDIFSKYGEQARLAVSYTHITAGFQALRKGDTQD